MPRVPTREPTNGPYDVLLKDGDKLTSSEAYTGRHGSGRGAKSHLACLPAAGLTRDDYIQKSGGVTQHADRKRIYVVRANGDVVSGYRSGWFRRSQKTDIRPGDTIVVPMDTQKVPLATASRRHHDHHLQSGHRLHSGPPRFVTGWLDEESNAAGAPKCRLIASIVQRHVCSADRQTVTSPWLSRC